MLERAVATRQNLVQRNLLRHYRTLLTTPPRLPTNSQNGRSITSYMHVAAFCARTGRMGSCPAYSRFTIAVSIREVYLGKMRIYSALGVARALHVN